MSYVVLEYITASPARVLDNYGPDYPTVLSKEILTASATPISGASRGTVPAGCGVVLVSVFDAGSYGVAVKVGPDATITNQSAAKTDASKILTSAQPSYPLKCAPGDRITAVDVSLP